MPCYDFQCQSNKSHKFEHFLFFNEFDSGKTTGIWPICPKCNAPSKLSIPDEPPHGNVTNNDSLGKIAENNSKKFGKYGVEDRTLAEQKKRKPLKKRKNHWYGELGTQKTKEIFNEKDPAKRAKKMNDYVIDGK